MSVEEKNKNPLIHTLIGGITMVDVRIVVPMAFNNNKPIPANVIQEIERNIRYSAGAFSRYSNFGVLEDGKRLFSDFNFEYKIVTSKNGVTDLKNIAEDVKKVCQQEAVFFSVSPTIVSFI